MTDNTTKPLHTRASNTSVPSNVFAVVKELKSIDNNMANMLSFRMQSMTSPCGKKNDLIGVTAL